MTELIDRTRDEFAKLGLEIPAPDPAWRATRTKVPA
jgi:hypothetical protein